MVPFSRYPKKDSYWRQKSECLNCNNDICHAEMYAKFITSHFENIPSMQYATEIEWKYTLYSQYWLLYNFGEYVDKNYQDKEGVSYPYTQYYYVPRCLQLALAEFISHQMYKSMAAWYKKARKNFTVMRVLPGTILSSCVKSTWRNTKLI